VSVVKDWRVNFKGVADASATRARAAMMADWKSTSIVVEKDCEILGNRRETASANEPR
jgi:hypothetical protein